MEQHLRYKLRKVKKRWVTVTVAVGVLTLSGLAASPAVSAQAAETEAAAAVQAQKTEAQQPAAETANQAAAAETAEAQSPAAAAAVTEASPAQTQQEQAQAAAQETPVQAAEAANQTAAAEAAAEAATPAAADQAAAVAEVDLDAIANVQKIGDQYFYIGADGQPKKNFALTVNGQTLFFDAETGALTDAGVYQFIEGLTSLVNDYTAHNQIANTSAQSLETVDGYVMADSWYRPQDILRGGTDWEASGENDLRPLLMTWWPDKQTQIAYLNYMNAQGLGTGTVYSANDQQAALSLAAQEVQRNIERRIAQENDTSWLRTIITNFVKTQPNWNIASESETTGTNKDHLQGGALLYVNSDLTPHANSDYRLLNRTPTSQTGEQKYFADNSVGGYEFLLANDIDNSHPAVQAEQLNWLHFLMNFGTIVANDPTANFDGVRIDAVDNVNADLLQIASDYFKSYYGVENSEADAINHLSILEAWSDNDPYYNRDTNGAQLPIDNLLRLSLLYAYMRPLSERSGMETAITHSLNNRSAEGKTGDRMANYVFVRAHDSEVQTVIAQIIRENINPETDGLTFTMDELKQAFVIYNEDMRQADKKYTQFNVPAAYALMLSNKDAITRVYYGDLYTDDGQYMETKSPYYDALDTLMRARYRYVAGGQDMAVVYPEGAVSTSPDFDNTSVLTSVRYGTGAETAADTGTEETRTQGMAVITANNPYLQLGASDTVTVNMGAAHRNQAYRPLLLTTTDGLATYLTDADVPESLIRYTDSEGNLTFDASDIAGYSNVQVSGYLAVWVPVGAAADQDVRVAPSTEPNTSGKVYQSSAALDSQLIYEGFSNFQDFVENESQYTNKLIAENIDLFKAWGVTSFEMAPQYVSSEDGSFLDAIILNGYAFEDRYDIAMSKNNKYGSLDDLLNALRALHGAGIQAIADWVPDQIYNLPNPEVVTATRVNNYGEYREDSIINQLLYAAKTRSSGQDYQAQYGGAFLDELKANYPEIFERVQISTGQKMDPDTKITEWKAEYFNGTNILGRGAYYVLKDWGNKEYFVLNDGQVYLPKQLTNQEAATGFVNDGQGMTYLSTSGSQAKNAFIEDEKGNWYYFDQDGYMVYGQQVIDGETYYFLSNGVQLRNAILENADGTRNYFSALGKRYSGGYHSFNIGKERVWRHFDDNGVMSVGLQVIDGETKYFDDNGIQAKGQWVTTADGQKRYFEFDSGNMAVSRFANDEEGNWYYIGSDGLVVTGIQTIGGKTYYFAEDGKQVKGVFVTDADGSVRYYHANSGELVTADFVRSGENTWYYLGADGVAVTGDQTINGQLLYFNADGTQAKGVFVTDAEGRVRYYHPDSGDLLISRFEADAEGNWYYLGTDGVAVTGSQTIDSQRLFFAADGKQVKGNVATDESNILRYYDKDSGDMVFNQIVSLTDGRRVAIDAEGVARYI